MLEERQNNNYLKKYESTLISGIRKASLLGALCGFGNGLVGKSLDKTQQELWNYEGVLNSQERNRVGTEYMLDLKSKFLKLRVKHTLEIFRGASL